MATTAELLIFRPRICRFQHVEHDLNFLIKLKPPTRALANLVKRKDKKKMMENEKLLISQLFSYTSLCSEFGKVATWTSPVTCDARRPSFHMIQFFPSLRQCRLSAFNLLVAARHPPFDIQISSLLQSWLTASFAGDDGIELRRLSLINLINWFNSINIYENREKFMPSALALAPFNFCSGIRCAACVAIRFSQIFCQFSAWTNISTSFSI